MSELGDLIVGHGRHVLLAPIQPEEVDALRDELIALRRIRDEQGEPEWHRGCTWCWRTAWHPPEADK